MSELRAALIGDSAHTPPLQVIEALPPELAHAHIAGAPHTIYQELWHIAFWLQITLSWIDGVPTTYPANPNDAFASESQSRAEPWDHLRGRFKRGIEQAASLTTEPATLARLIQCPSRPGAPTRIMSVQDQLVSLAAHNAYHFGRIVLMRQLLGSWPPPSGGFTW
jgi:uncharacterized damage-inducible protein DinB